MANKFGALRARMTPAAQARSAANAQMEKWADMYLSTLRSHIEAMGGQLEIVARFPDGAAQISNFAELGQTSAT